MTEHPIPAADPGLPDPIFAAIERHRAAEAGFCAVLGLVDEAAAKQEGRKVTPRDRKKYEAASEAADEALAALVSTAPLTAAGARAVISYCADEDSAKESLTDFLETLLKSPVLTETPTVAKRRPALKISDAQDMLYDVKQLIMAMDIALGYADFDESLSGPVQVVGRAAREKIDEIKRLLEESGAQLREGCAP